MFDYHTHSRLCKHASGELIDYVQVAISKKLNEIGLSDHFPMTFLPEEFHKWSMSLNEFPEYMEQMKSIKKKFANKIIIRLATEVDYYKDSFNDYKKAISPYLEELDYLIGSVHTINVDGYKALPIDIKEAQKVFKEVGIDKIYCKYYNAINELVKTGMYQIVGHIDLPKKYGLLPDDKELIWEQILTTLDNIKSSGMAVEINTSGLRKKVNEQYPSMNIIEELIKRDIPLTLGSDAHEPKEIAYSFNEIIHFLKKHEVNHLYGFKRREMYKLPL